MRVFENAAISLGLDTEVRVCFSHLDDLYDDDRTSKAEAYYCEIKSEYPSETQRVNDYIDGYNDSICRAYLRRLGL